MKTMSEINIYIYIYIYILIHNLTNGGSLSSNLQFSKTSTSLNKI